MMYHKRKIYLIDSQDAVYGNIAYDLASLIDDVRFKTSKELKNRIFKMFVKLNSFIDENKLKDKFDFLVVDFHGEITSEKMAIGHIFDGSATLVVGTHTHVPTNDGRILNNGTAYLTDAGMCGDYNSVIGMDKQNSINRFFKKDSVKHFPAEGEATLSGVIVDCDIKTGLAKKIKSFIFGGQLTNT